MQKLTHSQLAEAHDRQDWTALWTAAVPVVNQIVGGMYRLGDLGNVDREELEQEGALLAGALIRSWNPLLGTFRTWLAVGVRRHLFKIVNRNGAQEAATDKSVDVEQLPADGTESTEETDKAHILALLDRLPAHQAAFMRKLYGLGCEAMSAEEYAVAHDVFSYEVYRARDILLAKMREAA
jgi:DNA-directed RNA polymerase specialized sigma24 family protein